AGGGIVDARGVVAALALGAEAAYMGTRFLATAECTAHPRMKQAVIEAIDTSTIAFGRMTGLSRCIKNEYTKGHLEMEKRGASFDEVREYERSGAALGGWRRIPAALVAGNIEHGATAAGAASGMIKRVESAGEVVRQIVAEAPVVIARMG
ncbi:MAG: nitronate monooxygenase, partial [Dehalococcoidia bacterium]|nr:nitronate monooxygenase [Dehalococcoidia bacterium]